MRLLIHHHQQQLQILHRPLVYKDSVRHLSGRKHQHTPIAVDVGDQVIHGLVVMQVITLMDIVFITKNVFIGNLLTYLTTLVNFETLLSLYIGTYFRVGLL